MGRKPLTESEKKVSYQVKVDPQLFEVIKNQMKKKDFMPKYSMNMALRELIGETKISKLIVQNAIYNLEKKE